VPITCCADDHPRTRVRPRQFNLVVQLVREPEVVRVNERNELAVGLRQPKFRDALTPLLQRPGEHR
jgi:hypothetical protein